jgi:hypothetical protein
MTPEQRAAKVLDSIPIGMTDEYWLAEVASAIQAAMDDAYEEAATLVGSEVVWTPEHIVLLIQKIRALKEKP